VCRRGDGSVEGRKVGEEVSIWPVNLAWLGVILPNNFSKKVTKNIKKN